MPFTLQMYSWGVHTRASRLARGWIAGVFATGVAALGHGLADGASPSLLSIVVGVVFAGMLGTLVIGRRPSLPRLAVIVAVSQVAFHGVFSWLTPVATTMTLSHHGAPLAPVASPVLTPVVTPVIGEGVAHHGTDPWMWVAHGVAMLATVVFLRRVELALWKLLRDALHATRISRIATAIVGQPALVRIVPELAPRHPVAPPLFSVVSHRGPPALGFAH